MTEDSKRQNIALEIAKAEREMQSARMVMEGSLFDIAVAHAYYAAFHYARALVLMEGLEARSHSGVIHLVNLHLVRTGRLDPNVADGLSQLQTRRERADYDVAAMFTEAMATEAMEKARQFSQAADTLLREAGYH